MPAPAARSAYWLRRVTALAATIGLILISSLAPATAFAQSTAGRSTAGRSTTAGQQSAAGCPSPPKAPSLGTTVTGPNMYEWKTKSISPCPSSVTVSQTKDLANQMVKVSWTGFTPSKAGPYEAATTLYPVEVAECKGSSPGTDPSALKTDCYWAANFGQAYTPGKYGPSNDTWATSSATGTGYADIQIETFQQNQQLNCSSTHDCSLLILPIEGGFVGDPPSIKPDCAQHRWDATGDPALGGLPGYATGQKTLVAPFLFYGDACSWPDRIVVPLHFAPVPKNCGFSNPAFSVAGSPLMVRAMTSWQSGLCNGSHSDPIAYDGTVGEPEARSIFLAGGDDNVALTTDPASGPGKHPFTYAPVGITAASVAYWVDNDKTGLPYTNLKLTPLLLTKMLTQSYEYGQAPPGYACTPAELQHPPTTAPGCDPGVLHDPQNVLSDPEFRQLNPGLHLNEVQSATVGVPTVQQGQSDMTWEVTRWIAANQASSSFLTGQVDQWGEHVNTFYLNLQYPTQQFISQDNRGPVAYDYTPVSPPSRVATYMADNQPSGNYWVDGPCIGSHADNCPQSFTAEMPGQRQLFAVLDNADAQSFLMPTMKIENGAGDYVGPTKTAMAAAVKSMTSSGGGGITQEYNEASKNAAAYPLTMVVYAMVPTGGLSHAKAGKIAQWLDYVAGPGQRQGMLPGQLPPGYLPLTAKMRAQTRKAAYQVLHQTGDHSSHPGGQHGGNGSNGGGGGSNGSGGGSSSNHNGSSPSSGPSSGSTPKNTVNAAFASPFSGTSGMVLIIVLIVGGLLAIAGPAAVVLGKPGGRAAVAAGWHRVLALRHATRKLPGRKKP